MSKAAAWRTNLLRLIFQNQPAMGIGDAFGLAGSKVAGHLHLSLHTGSPVSGGAGIGDSQTSMEADYTRYERVAVPRSAVGWLVRGNSAENAGQVIFKQCEGGTNLITHFGIGTEPRGVGRLLYSGKLADVLAVSNGVTVRFEAGDVVVTEN